MTDHESKVPHLPPIVPKNLSTKDAIAKYYKTKHQEFMRLRRDKKPKTPQELAYFSQLAKEVKELHQQLESFPKEESVINDEKLAIDKTVAQL